MPPRGRDFRTRLSGVGDETNIGPTDLVFKPWDLSLKPGNNNRAVKLGNFFASHGAAVAEFDKDLQRVRTVDGVKHGEESSVWPMEPDNHMLRRHGGNEDRVWALRMIVDHENPHTNRLNRSTWIMNQGSFQEFAGLQDLMWIGDLKAAQDQIASITGGGFAADMGVGVGKGTRGVACLNVSKKGYVTDGAKIGQLSHILTFLAPGGPGGSTVAPGTAVGPGKVPFAQGELGIQATCGFKYPNGSTISWPVIEEAGAGEAEADDDIAREVHFAEGPPIGHIIDMADDPLSNQPEIKANDHPALRAIVNLPKEATDD